MWSLFAAAAKRTSRLRLGPEVAPIILKDPTIIAQQAATLDELTGGRAELVFSTGNFALLQQYGVDLRGTKPIARLREAPSCDDHLSRRRGDRLRRRLLLLLGPLHGGAAR